MIDLLLVWFFGMFVYGMAYNPAIGIFSLFCGACLYYFYIKMLQRYAAWEVSPDAAKAPPDTLTVLYKADVECSDRRSES